MISLREFFVWLFCFLIVPLLSLLIKNILTASVLELIDLLCWAMVGHTFTPSTQEAETGGFLWVWGQPGQQSEFQHSQDYIEKPCFQKPNQNNKTQHQSCSIARLELRQFSCFSFTNATTPLCRPCLCVSSVLKFCSFEHRIYIFSWALFCFPLSCLTRTRGKCCGTPL